MNQRRGKVDRQRKVAELRLSGVTDQCTVAKLLHVSQSTISRDFAELDERFRERADEQTAAAKGIDLERLDTMISGLWSKAIAGDTFAVDRVLKCLERRANILGLDAPAKKDITLHSYAEVAAQRYGLDAKDVLAEAERILAEVS